MVDDSRLQLSICLFISCVISLPFIKEHDYHPLSSLAIRIFLKLSIGTNIKVEPIVDVFILKTYFISFDCNYWSIELPA